MITNSTWSSESAALNVRAVPAPSTSEGLSTDWRRLLPTLAGDRVRLRQLRPSDATSLSTLLTTPEVARFISPPPATLGGFERFITWMLGQQRDGANLCFAVTLQGQDTAIGIFQVRRLDQAFETAEWGFAVGSAFWGTGVFQEGAALTLDFVFDTLGVHRLEARAAVRNGRGVGALLKIGAVQEGTLRKSFLRNGQHHDQGLFTILAEDWRKRPATARPSARVH